MADTQEKLLTPRQLAEMLGVVERTVETWRHRKVGPKFIRVSQNRDRYRAADVEEWLKMRTRTN
jgi:predicted DNA-binding transcriptional regulator AlpA